MRTMMVLQEFDGRDRSGLEALVEDGLSDMELALVCDVCSQNDARIGRGAMWIVRTLLEKKRGEGLDLAKVYRNLPADLEWVTRYHLLQTVQYAPQLATAYISDVRALLEHDRTAIRVAALAAFTHLATVDESIMGEARARLMQNVEDPKPSIRARTRHMLEMLAKRDGKSSPKKKRRPPR